MCASRRDEAQGLSPGPPMGREFGEMWSTQQRLLRGNVSEVSEGIGECGVPEAKEEVFPGGKREGSQSNVGTVCWDAGSAKHGSSVWGSQ